MDTSDTDEAHYFNFSDDLFIKKKKNKSIKDSESFAQYVPLNCSYEWFSIPEALDNRVKKKEIYFYRLQLSYYRGHYRETIRLCGDCLAFNKENDSHSKEILEILAYSYCKLHNFKLARAILTELGKISALSSYFLFVDAYEKSDMHTALYDYIRLCLWEYPWCHYMWFRLGNLYLNNPQLLISDFSKKLGGKYLIDFLIRAFSCLTRALESSHGFVYQKLKTEEEMLRYFVETFINLIPVAKKIS
jgi:hypothetical protein